MTRILLAAGVATLAISAPAAAAPHGGHGGGNGGGHAAAQKPNGGGHAQAQAKAHVQARAEVKANNHAQARAQQRTQVRMAEHAQARHKQQVRTVERAQARHRDQVRTAQRAQDQRRADVRVAKAREERIRDARANQAQRIREADANRIRDLRHDQRIREARADDFARIRARQNDRVAVGYGVGGCPPGLAKKAVACMPPGQANKLLGARARDVRKLAAMEAVPVRLRSIYRDTPNYYYQYGDGYVYRVNRNNDLVSALMPLFGAGLTAGQVFPSAYNSYALPAAYQPFYPAGSPYDYRYANGYVYQVDPYTGMIANVDPMLGYGYGYGQMMPASYAAYNVPYQYRPYYYDTSDYYYRYAPGAIYQVDPQTSLITGIAALLTGGMTVGQPMPTGYSAYNVPYDYRAQYYDTPDNWYRYANGNIYRVDPATQLVTALVASALT